MKKTILIAAIGLVGLSGCATTAALTPCEKALLAKYAAEKILAQVCPLSEPPAESTEGVY